MPKTIINEFDNTSSLTTYAVTNTVYIPCSIKKFITVDESGVEELFRFKKLAQGTNESDLLPHLLTSAQELEDLVEDSSLKATYENTISGSMADPVDVEIKPDNGMSYDLARYLLNNGLYVLLQIVTQDEEEAWSYRFNSLRDKGLYDVKFLSLGEFAGSSECNISDIVGCAERRGDCIALIDHPIKLEANESGDESSSYSERVHEWAKSVSSSYAAMFSPWASNTLHNAGTKANPVYPMLPPSFSFLVSYANSVKTNPNWLSAAGAFRGTVPGLVKVEHKYGEQDVDNLQCRVTSFSGGQESFGDGDNKGIAVNPICNVEPFGVIVWGNRTALDNGPDGLKATSFLNIRNLACDLKKTMWKAARKYTFEQNTLRLWLKFCSQIRPLLDEAKTGEGISSYKLIKEPTTAKARLKASVVIVPIEAVEDFELSFVLEDTIETEESVG